MLFASSDPWFGVLLLMALFVYACNRTVKKVKEGCQALDKDGKIISVAREGIINAIGKIFRK